MSDTMANNGSSGVAYIRSLGGSLVGAVSIAGAVLTVVYVVMYQPLQQDGKEKLGIREHEQYKEAVAKDLVRIDSDLIRLRGELVSREEHKNHWDGEAADIVRLQKEIDTIQSSVGNSYTLGDQIKHLQQELDEVRKAQK